MADSALPTIKQLGKIEVIEPERHGPTQAVDGDCGKDRAAQNQKNESHRQFGAKQTVEGETERRQEDPRPDRPGDPLDQQLHAQATAHPRQTPFDSATAVGEVRVLCGLASNVHRRLLWKLVAARRPDVVRGASRWFSRQSAERPGPCRLDRARPEFLGPLLACPAGVGARP